MSDCTSKENKERFAALGGAATNFLKKNGYYNQTAPSKSWNDCIPKNSLTLRAEVVLAKIGLALTHPTDNNTFVRRARKEHRCASCQRAEAIIHKGEVYIEYCGESSPFQGGQRYHRDCAIEQGLIRRAAEGEE